MKGEDQIELATAFGVRELGTALVVISDSRDFREEGHSGLVYNHSYRIEVDYQSGTKLPHSKGSADLTYAQAPVNQCMKEEKKTSQFVLCIKNEDCDDLELRKIYQVLPDEEAAEDGYIRVIDESGCEKGPSQTPVSTSATLIEWPEKRRLICIRIRHRTW